ncbi:toll/interleukin-1 receptor domain-containing protein [Actinokineospora sp. HBU206404]|uniref:Toll/interleukin-1 receptor domain-containing protein n=2 Tax=Actinokineospora xionganensis TaxID=2684470 RepID=A0ABR7LAJ9_9PSEU|nr:toll/interleukin-1 receptor domain-containing protein [Actinokineospora xionganensis]
MPDDLPRGPLRELTEALHELYRAAGTPGLRMIADTVTEDDRFRDTVSHQKVSAMLHGSGMPKWSKLEPVVRVLAEWSTPQRSSSDEARRFKQLWDAVNGGDVPAAHPTDEQDGRVRSVFVLGGVTGETNYPDFEKAELERFSQRLGATVAQSGADLIVCSPFPDSVDFHALRGFVEARAGGTVHMHRPRHPHIENKYTQLLAILDADAGDQIKSWFYPGPEIDDPDSLGQAWLLCQLMAMEQADALITVGGKLGKSANTILHLAEARQQPVVPFAFLGGAAERVFLRRDWGRSHPWLDPRKLMDKNAVGEAMVIANQMVTARVRALGLPQRPDTVFVSRARLDVEYARALDDYLSSAGLRVLFGERELPADRTVESAIEDAVLRSDLFIVLWSRSYAASRYCYDEIQLALKRYRAGELRLWIINIDGSDIVPPGARGLPQLAARSPTAVVNVVRDLLADAR